MKYNAIAWLILNLLVRSGLAEPCDGQLFKRVSYKQNDTLEIWILGESPIIDKDGYWLTSGYCFQAIASGKIGKQLFEGEIDSVGFKIEDKGLLIKTISWDPLEEKSIPLFVTKYDPKLNEIGFMLIYKGHKPTKKDYQDFLKELTQNKDRYIYKNQSFEGKDGFLELYLPFGISDPEFYINQMDSLMSKTDLRNSAAGGETVDRIKSILETIKMHRKHK